MAKTEPVTLGGADILTLPSHPGKKRIKEKKKAAPSSTSAASGMEDNGKCYRSGGYSSEATSLIMSSWRPATHRAYNMYIKTWRHCTHTHNLDLSSPSVPKVTDFLVRPFLEGASYNTIISVRSALSAFFDNTSVRTDDWQSSG